MQELSKVYAPFPDSKTIQNEPQLKRALSSINGIAGWAKGGFSEVQTTEQMFARLRARFVGRGEHRETMAHPLFDDYLIKKARELTGEGE